MKTEQKSQIDPVCKGTAGMKVLMAMTAILGSLPITNLAGQEPKAPEVTEEKMMSYLPQHLSKISPYSWDKPQRWAVAKGSGFTAEEVDLIGNAAKLIHLSTTAPVEDKENFRKRHPDRIYKFAGMNLERDYYGPSPKEKPSWYLYNQDGSIYNEDKENPDDLYLNLAVPECREWWLDHAQMLIKKEPQTDMFFIDALAKACAVAEKSKFYDHEGNRMNKQDYMEVAVRPLLTEIRNRFSSQIMLTGNFFRTNPKTCRSEWCEYIQTLYLEGFERPGSEHNGIKFLQPLIAAGKAVELTLNKEKPHGRAKAMTSDEMKEKAKAAMPELWEKLDADEQKDLAEMYAYFDYKLAMFLICAGEHSYFKFAATTQVKKAGPDLFRLVPPFPEWNMPLGPPLKQAVREGDVWTRKFQHVEVHLDIANGQCKFIPRK